MLPFIQVKKWANRDIDILVGVNWCKPEDTLAQKEHVISLSRVRTRGSYWSTLEDTLAHGGQVITLSGNKITTSYCSVLEENRLVNWDKNSIQFGYQYS